MKNLETLVKCYSCHKILLVENIIDGNIKKMFHPEHCQTEFYLKSGSRMPVALCLSCKDTLDLNSSKTHNDLMNNIISAWQYEMDYLLENGQITKQQANDAMEYHRSLSINFKSEGLNDYQIKARIRK